eukprot:TRINITY_DN1404_c0_g1_i2.p1 TRINITY_DN1404_c0_g1~~TRINITY_DN1404_c0_g1_i2.p1  ORF type:complete len:1712 (-),score=660.31 TRINITY_DN1404_c0_g1_i2:1157-6262(-)
MSLFRKNTKTNAIKDNEKVKEPHKHLQGDVLKKLSGRDLSYAEYPTYLYFDDERFKLRSIKGIEVVNAVALKELRLNKNKLKILHGDDLNRFVKLKRIDASQNHIQSVEDLSLEKLVELNLNSNQLTQIPNLNECTALEELRLSLNTLTGNKTMFEGIEKCAKLKMLELNKNAMKLKPKEFVKAMAHLGRYCPKLQTLDLRDNKFRNDFPDYRAWVAQKVPSLKNLDGEQVTNKERKKKLPDVDTLESGSKDKEEGASSSSSSGEGSSSVAQVNTEGVNYDVEISGNGKDPQKKGKDNMVTFKFQDFIQTLFDCFATPDEAYEKLTWLDSRAESMANTPSDVRHIVFDGGDLSDSEHFVSDIFELVENYNHLAEVCISIQMRLMAIKSDGIPLGELCRMQLMQYSVDEKNVEALVRALENVIVETLIQNELLPTVTKNDYLSFLNQISQAHDVGDSLLSLIPMLTKMISEQDPSDDVIGLVKAAARSEHGAQALTAADMAIQVSSILDAEEKKSIKSSRFLSLIGIVEHQSRNDPEATEQYVETQIHMRLLDYCDKEISSLLGEWDPQDCEWLASIVGAINGICENSKDALMAILQSPYLDHLLSMISDPSIYHQLLSTALKSILQFLRLTDDVTIHRKIADGIGYMVPLLEYVEGKGYERLCEQMGELDEEGEPVPLNDMMNKDMYEVLRNIVALIDYYAYEAVCMQSVATMVCDALDTAGRERYLFSLLTVPDDDIRLLTVNCLSNVPKNNLQENEVNDIVRIVQDVRNVGSGRTEEVLAVVLSVLQSLAVSRGEEGHDYRQSQVGTVMIVLNLLEKNEARDTSDSEEETEEKAELTRACVSYLKSCSNWPQAVEAMQQEAAVEKMCNVLRLEDIFGSDEFPVMIEQTALGNSMAGLMGVLPQLEPRGNVAGRVMNRMAEVLEGKYGRQPTEDEDNQVAKIWERMDINSEPEEEREFRVRQIHFFMRANALNMMIDFLGADEELGAVDPEEEGGTSLGAGIGGQDGGESSAMGGVIEYQGEYAPTKLLADVMRTKDQEEERVAAELAAQLALKNQEEEETEEESEEEIQRRKKAEVEASKNSIRGVEVGESMFDANDDDDDLGTWVMPAGKVKLGNIRITGQSLPLTTTPESLTTSSLMRIVMALMWYSEEDTIKDEVRERLQEIEAMQLFANLAKRSKWYNHNVGARFLDVVYEVLSMSNHQVENNIAVINLYDIVSQMMTDMVADIESHLNEGLSLTPRQELLMLNISRVWNLLLQQMPYMQFGEDVTVQEACLQHAFRRLIPMAALNTCIRYLFYHHSIDNRKLEQPNGSQPFDSPHIFNISDRAAHATTKMIAAYVQVRDDVRYEVLEQLTALEVREHIALRETHIQYLLDIVDHRTYHRALERYMVKEQLTASGSKERIIKFRWLSHVVNSTANPRCLVLTTNCIYLLKEASGKKCTACSPDKFCPKGPTVKQELEYSAIEHIMIGFGEKPSRFAIKTSKPNRSWVFAADHYGDAQEFCDVLHDMTKVPVVTNNAFWVSIMGAFDHVLDQQAKQLGSEIIQLTAPVMKTNEHGAVQPRLFVLTGQHIHNFKEHLGKWGNPKKEMDTLDHRSHFAINKITRIVLSNHAPSMVIEFNNRVRKSDYYEIEFADDHQFSIWKRALSGMLPKQVFSEDGLPPGYYEQLQREEEERMIEKQRHFEQGMVLDNKGKGKGKQ